MFKALVTGGAGFIGSNIVKALVGRGCEVTVLDDFSMGVEENLKGVDCITVKGDIRDYDTVERCARGKDFVFNEASLSSAPLCENDPVEAMRVNAMGMMNVLEASRKNRVKRVVYAATSSVYSRCKPPHKEDMHVDPATFYELTKFINEQCAGEYSERFGVETVGLRYFSIYGPNEKPKGKYANLVSQFLWDILEGKKPVIYGDGTQTRDFVFVDDCVRANLLAMEKPGISGEIINVGSGRMTSINELVKVLNEECKTSIEPSYVQNPIKNYVYAIQADTKKAREKLGFETSIDLREGVRRIITFLKK
jgi:UDP-glucose 4-epimerase